MAKFQQSPGYGYQVQQGLRAVDAGAASQGILRIGRDDQGRGDAGQQPRQPGFRQLLEPAAAVQRERAGRGEGHCQRGGWGPAPGSPTRMRAPRRRSRTYTAVSGAGLARASTNSRTTHAVQQWLGGSGQGGSNYTDPGATTQVNPATGLSYQSSTNPALNWNVLMADISRPSRPEYRGSRRRTSCSTFAAGIRRGRRIQQNQLLSQGKQIDLANANMDQVARAAAGLLAAYPDEASRAKAYPRSASVCCSRRASRRTRRRPIPVRPRCGSLVAQSIPRPISTSCMLGQQAGQSADHSAVTWRWRGLHGSAWEHDSGGASNAGNCCRTRNDRANCPDERDSCARRPHQARHGPGHGYGYCSEQTA